MAVHHHPEAGTAAPDRTGARVAAPQRPSTPASGQQSARGPPTTLAPPSSLTPSSPRGKLFPFTAPSQLVDLYGPCGRHVGGAMVGWACGRSLGGLCGHAGSQTVLPVTRENHDERSPAHQAERESHGMRNEMYLSKRCGSRSFFVASMGSALKQNFYNIVSKQAM